MRTSSPLLLRVLAACSGAPQDEAASQTAAASAISCAVSGATVFAARCHVEQSPSKDGLILTLRHPDGGFRRLLVVRDGRGVIAADGADKAVVTPIAGNMIEVSLSGDTYRLPATVRGAGRS